MGSPLGERTRGMLRRHWLVVLAALVTVSVLLAMLLGVREKVAGFQLEATVAPAVDPAAIPLDAALEDEFDDLTRSPTLAEISRFFTEPGTRNMVGAYQSTDLDVTVDEDRELVMLVIGDDLRERTELSLQLYLDGYLEHRRLQARQRAFPVADRHENVLLALEERAAGAASTGDPELAAELEIEAARLSVTVDEIRAFPVETNGGIETSVIDVGRSVWRTSVSRAVLALLGGVAVTALGVLLVAATDRRIRTRSDLALVDADIELLGALGPGPASGRENDDQPMREVLLARLPRDRSTLALVAIDCDEDEPAAVERLVGESHDCRVVAVSGRIDEAEVAAVLESDTTLVLLGWGRAGLDEATVAIGQIRGAAQPLIGALVVGVPRREIAPAFR